MERSISQGVQLVHAQNSARRTLWSGSHAQEVVRCVTTALDEYESKAIMQARKILPILAMWQLAFDTVRLADLKWRDRLAGFVWPGTNSRRHTQPGSAAYQAVFKMYDDAATARVQRSRLARFDFADDGLAPSKHAERATPSAQQSPKTLAGRLPAQWWDDLWIEIFRQIHLGDLKPTKQADIVQAMLQWLSDRDVHVSEGTVKPRARKLMAMLRTLDD